MNRAILSIAALALALFAPGIAAAHTFGASGAGFAQGFGHPFGGLDHLLAMIAVGLWAAQIGGRALWAVPLAFLGVMALGAFAGMAGVALPGLELGIGGSVVLLGLLIAARLRLPWAAAAGVAGLFALFHGVAHGAEVPTAATPLLYGVGFMLASAALHGFGIGVHRASRVAVGAALVRAGGAAIAVVGVLIVAGV